jgi:predicted nucleic acid-binding protein
MIILDTNVISAVMRRTPEPVVVAWLDRQPAPSLWTTAVTVFEIAFGLRLLDPGRRREQLETAFAKAIDEDFEGRILPFDRSAAAESAILAQSQRRAGRTVEVRDVLIAGIAVARRAALATRNSRHFADLGIDLINPWNDPG